MAEAASASAAEAGGRGRPGLELVFAAASLPGHLHANEDRVSVAYTEKLLQPGGADAAFARGGSDDVQELLDSGSGDAAGGGARAPQQPGKLSTLLERSFAGRLLRKPAGGYGSGPNAGCTGPAGAGRGSAAYVITVCDGHDSAAAAAFVCARLPRLLVKCWDAAAASPAPAAAAPAAAAAGGGVRQTDSLPIPPGSVSQPPASRPQEQSERVAEQERPAAAAPRVPAGGEARQNAPSPGAGSSALKGLLDGPPAVDLVAIVFRRCFARLERAFWREARRENSTAGTCVVSLLVSGTTIRCAGLGDCRALCIAAAPAENVLAGGSLENGAPVAGPAAVKKPFVTETVLPCTDTDADSFAAAAAAAALPQPDGDGGDNDDFVAPSAADGSDAAARPPGRSATEASLHSVPGSPSPSDGATILSSGAPFLNSLADPKTCVPPISPLSSLSYGSLEKTDRFTLRKLSLGTRETDVSAPPPSRAGDGVGDAAVVPSGDAASEESAAERLDAATDSSDNQASGAAATGPASPATRGTSFPLPLGVGKLLPHGRAAHPGRCKIGGRQPAEAPGGSTPAGRDADVTAFLEKAQLGEANVLEGSAPEGSSPVFEGAAPVLGGSARRKRRAPSRRNLPVQLTWLNRPHRLDQQAEYDRVTNLKARVDADLRLRNLEPSRTIGDFDVKGVVPAGAVSCRPCVSCFPVLAPTLVVVATDGVWDGVSGPKLVSLLKRHRKRWNALMQWLAPSTGESIAGANSTSHEGVARFEQLQGMAQYIVRKCRAITGDDTSCVLAFVAPLGGASSQQ